MITCDLCGTDERTANIKTFRDEASIQEIDICQNCRKAIELQDIRRRLSGLAASQNLWHWCRVLDTK